MRPCLLSLLIKQKGSIMDALTLTAEQASIIECQLAAVGGTLDGLLVVATHLEEDLQTQLMPLVADAARISSARIELASIMLEGKEVEDCASTHFPFWKDLV